MTLEEMLDRLSRRARPGVLAFCGLAVLGTMHVGRRILARSATEARHPLSELSRRAEESAGALSEAAVLRDEKLRALAAFKVGLPKLTEARRQVYEGGLQLQEEKRLLEKQLEIMTTYLLVDQGEGKVHLMRGEQSLESYAISPLAPRSYGTAKPAPGLTAIVSKERYAHPERPKSEQVEGRFQWEPPQVGESARAGALGEFVVFTRGSLILHGPPRSQAEHAAFAHVCLELSLPVARKLYSGSFIGTKIMLKRAK